MPLDAPRSLRLRRSSKKSVSICPDLSYIRSWCCTPFLFANINGLKQQHTGVVCDLSIIISEYERRWKLIKIDDFVFIHVFSRRDRTYHLGLLDFVRFHFPNKIELRSVWYVRFVRYLTKRPRSILCDCRNQSNSIERWSSIQFDCIRLKFCTVMFD